MKAERKWKVRKLKLKIWKTCKESDPKIFSIKPTCYENSKALSRTNLDLDRPTKDSKKVNLVPENQPESSERQQAEGKGLKASFTVMKTSSNSPTLTGLAENVVAEFKEFERRFKFKPRFKYGWFNLKLYQMFQDLSRR